MYPAAVLPKNGEHEWRPPAPSQYSTQFFFGLLTGSGFSFGLSIFRARSAHSIIVQRSWVLVKRRNRPYEVLLHISGNPTNQLGGLAGFTVAVSRGAAM